MNLIIGIADIIIIAGLIVLNIKYWYKAWGYLMDIFIVLLYLFILPFVSMGIEAEIVSRTFDMVEGFNFLYAWFRFPFYWGLFIIQLIVNYLKP